jgi:fibronectin-binding autotransporter adhesin
VRHNLREIYAAVPRLKQPAPFPTMTYRPNHSPTVRILLGSILAVVAVSAHAQTRSWTTIAPGGDTGNWSEAAKWSGTDVPDTAGENATFGGYANNRTIALDNSYTIGTLTIVPRTTGFTSTTFALTGTNTLTLNTGFNIGGGTSVSIAPNLVIAADQTWTTLGETGVAPTTISGVVSGPGKITRAANVLNTGAGLITFSGANTFSGGFTQTAAFNTTRLGASSVITGGLIESGGLGTGTVTLNAGTLSGNNTTARSLSNNVVVGGNLILGNATNNGALTFSDVGLTTATTFTLGNATTGNVTVLRTPNTALTFDQVIAESGGAGQSVLFATTSGTPIVTINRTKTATGNLLAGGVGLVLGNGAANSGNLIGVNGSITATGANKFSSGALISDNTALVATDGTNFSAVAGGKVTVLNNGRLSFATDQTQAALAALVSGTSRFRLGLGSGSGSATVTENYDQSALGNGRAGLVSASSGTITYTGTLTAGSDNTFRVGGGLGTLSFTGNTLTGSGKNVSVEGGGTLSVSANQDFNGTATINSATSISGASGAFSATSGITVNNNSLTLDNTTANANRLANSAGITLNRGTLAMNGSSTAIAESIGTLTINSGFNTISMGTAAGAANTKSINTGTLARTAGAVALFRGDNFGLASGGGSALTRNLVIVGAAPTGTDFVGGGGANGTTTISIIPWARTGTGTTATGGNFLTFDTSNNSLRPLVIASEFATNVDTAPNATDNVRQTVAATGTTVLLTGDRTRNSFILANAGATGATVGSLGGFTLSVTSGAVDLAHTVAQNFALNNGTLAFGSAEGVITNSGGSSSVTTVGAILTGSNGVTVLTNNGGIISLAGVNTFTGGITVGGNGNSIVAVDQDQRFGNAANNVTHAGGELRFFAAFTSTRGLTLLGNVGNNTLGNNTNSSTVTWNGNITGAGLLRLVNNAGTVGPGGFSLGGTNDYTGGTQIEGINVTGSNNSSFGSGTVTLIGANGNVAALSLTGSAPTLGGLRGTDGTVTLNPTGSSATLTVGSNNESSVFSGSIGQAAGKTANFTKTGTGTLVLAGSSTYTGPTTVTDGTLEVAGSLSATTSVSLTGGTLLLSGASERVNDAANVTLGSGGRLGFAPGQNSLTETLGSLVLAADSTLDFGTGNGNSFIFNGLTLGGFTLSIYNWSGTPYAIGQNDDGSDLTQDRLRFASALGLGDPDLASINFYSGAGTGFLGSGAEIAFNSPGIEIVPVPEPSSTALLGALALVGLIGWRERRRLLPA